MKNSKQINAFDLPLNTWIRLLKSRSNVIIWFPHCFIVIWKTDRTRFQTGDTWTKNPQKRKFYKNHVRKRSPRHHWNVSSISRNSSAFFHLFHAEDILLHHSGLQLYKIVQTESFSSKLFTLPQPELSMSIFPNPRFSPTKKTWGIPETSEDSTNMIYVTLHSVKTVHDE